MRIFNARLARVATFAVAGAALMPALAPAPALAQASGQTADVRNDPRRETLVKLSREITVEFNETPLGDVFEYLTRTTGANVLVYDLEEDPDTGFDPQTPVTLKVENRSALETIERIISRLNRSPDTISKFTWQLSEAGEFEIGSREALNQQTRIELYDLRDLLFVVPTFDNAPEFDLGNILSQSGQRGGSGGQSPFNTNSDDAERPTAEERAEAIIDMIQKNVEPDGWIELGGDAAQIEYYDGNLIVTAPDYVHRQIDGYRFWPRTLHRFGTRGARRFIEVVPAPTRRP